MIRKQDSGAVIHFYQKVLDKRTLIRSTTDFILRIFGLFYKKQKEIYSEDSNRIIQSIQATLFAKLDNYVKSIKVSKHNVIEIKFEKDSLIPVVSHHSSEDSNNILLNVFFKKIGWDEINVFRVFFIKYMEYYLKKFSFNNFDDEGSIKKKVADLSYIVQELLQNANEYSLDYYDYELIVQHIDNKIEITVSNFTDDENLARLKNIIKDINSSENLQDLILKYMLSSEKHLGLITSVFNYDVDKVDYNIENNEIVTVKMEMKLY